MNSLVAVSILCFAILSVGQAQQYDQDYYGPPQPYNFGYDVADEYGNKHNHQESSDASGVRRGSYGYTTAEGYFRIVDYVADQNGFRATVRTNEPGTASGGSADVTVESSAPPVYGGAPGAFRG
ncbi:cuticle protein 10.9-like [Ornithodoros turicata]|uniref:cuticle protein 10.9-like n=1 Tax=Ornithodoros turicata TaxID=34597 RepID=UPI0031391178